MADTSIESPRSQWLLRLLCGAALCLALYLTWQKWSGSITSIKGCGGKEGCGEVLGGEWSQWMLIPVTALAAGLYAAVLLITIPSIGNTLGRTGQQLLAGAAFLMLFAALWFGGLLVWKNVFCPYCFAMHGLGIGSALILLRRLWITRRGNAGVTGAALLSALAATGILIGGQVFGPRPATHLLTEGGLLAGREAPLPFVPKPEGPARNVYFFGKELAYDARTLPILGSPDAKYVLVEYFDYTCASCRDMYGDIKQLKTSRPGEFAFIVMPVPLNRACNAWMKAGMQDHAHACELASLALAAWKAAPEKFAELHDFLMTNPPSLLDAVTKANALCGKEALDAALKSPEVGQSLSMNFGVFARLTGNDIKMPKLLLRDETVMHGSARSTEDFIKTVNTIFPK